MEMDNITTATQDKKQQDAFLTFQVHFSAVTDYQRPFWWYKRKYNDEVKAAKSQWCDSFGNEPSIDSVFDELAGDGQCRKKAVTYFGQSRCTVLLKGRTKETGEQVLLRVKGFKPWFYLYDERSPHSVSVSAHTERISNSIMNFIASQARCGKFDNDKDLKLLSRYTTDNPASSCNQDRLQQGGDERRQKNDCRYLYTCTVTRARLLDGYIPNADDGGASVRTFDCYRVECPSKKARKIAIMLFQRELEALNAYCCRELRISSLGGGVSASSNDAPAVRLKLCEHEDNIKALSQFRAYTHISPMSWLTVAKADCTKVYTFKSAEESEEVEVERLVCGTRHPSHQKRHRKTVDAASLSYKAAYEVKCELSAVVLDADKKDVSPFRVVSMDIETYSHDGAFPKPEDARNPVIVIGTRSYIYNAPEGVPAEQTLRAIQFVLGSTDREGYYANANAKQQRDFEVRNYETEAELLKGYRDYIVTEFDADAILTWNGCGFDDNYLAVRAEKTATRNNTFRRSTSTSSIAVSDCDFFKMSILKDQLLTCKLDESSSNQTGDREMYVWDEGMGFAGRVFIDMMQQVKADKSTSYRFYSLDFVSNQMFGEHKIDLPYSTVFDNFINGGPIGRFQNAEYCDRDCELPFRIEQRMQSVISLMQMSAITNTEMFEILYKGQTRKAFNQIICEAHASGIILNRNTEIVQPEGFEGAIVIDTNTGCYTVPIPVLDFASLYPSIMISENLCYSTGLYRVDEILIGDRGGPEQDAAVEELLRRYPNLKLNRPQILCKDGSYLCPVYSENASGLLPNILRNLLKGRSAAKREMGAAYKAGDANAAAVHNARQLALKVSANSIYGFTGAPTSQYPRLTIAATVTYNGRCGIEKTKDFVCTKYTAQYMYVEILGMDCVPQEVIDKYEPIFHSRNPNVISARVIGGDTDSVFVWFPVMPTKEGLKIAIKVARHAADICTELLFKRPMELEYEKTYFPSIFCVKKRYAAGKYVTGDEKPEDIPIENEKKWRGYIECKGMETVRRDVPVFTSNLMITILYYILIQNDVARAYQVLNSELTRLLECRVEYEEMMITSQMQREDSYSNPDALAHVQVVRRMRERNPGSEYRVGDRVRFVYVRRSAKDYLRVFQQKKQRADLKQSAKTKKVEMKQADFAEDLAYAKENQLPLDIVYYFTRKLRKPIQKILVDTNPACKHMFDEWERKFYEKVTYGDSTGNVTQLLMLSSPATAVTDKAPLNEKAGEKRKTAPSQLSVRSDCNSLYTAKKQKLDKKGRAAAVEGKCGSIMSMFSNRGIPQPSPPVQNE